jgi:putative transposase
MTTNTTITPELLDQLLANYEKPEDLTGEDGLFKQLKKALIERALGAELTEHLGYEKGDPAGRGSGNSRNGTSPKTILTEDGEIDIAVPRDRVGSFEPQRWQTRRSVRSASGVSGGRLISSQGMRFDWRQPAHSTTRRS